MNQSLKPQLKMRNKKDNRYTVRFSDNDNYRLKELSEKLNIDVAKIIRYATIDLLNKYDKNKYE